MKGAGLLLVGILFVLCAPLAFADSANNVSDWADIPQEAMTSAGTARVLVLFLDPRVESLRAASATASLPVAQTDAASRQSAARAIAEADAALSEAVSAATDAILANLDAGTYKIDRRYNYTPLVALDISPTALERLLADERVVSVQPNTPTPLPKDEDAGESVELGTRGRTEGENLDPPSLLGSVGIIGATGAWGKGYTGEGWHVAILDSGIRSTHDFFAGKSIVEACYSLRSNCPNGGTSMLGAGAAAPAPSQYQGYDHGTHVAGIAAGHLAGDVINGVAKDADILAVNVFSQFSAAECGSADPCVLAYVSDQVSGLEYIYSLRGTLNIAAVNMSLGGGAYGSPCDALDSSRAFIIEKLYSSGIATVIATGNNGYCGAVGAPACISAAIAVSAVDDDDVEASFNNWSADLTDIWAPGVSILSSVASADNMYGYKSGTSMSTPHVTGAFAIQRQYAPTDSIERLFTRMTETGPRIESAWCQIAGSRPRVYVDHFQLMTGVKATITPLEARRDGAQWRVDDGDWHDDGDVAQVEPGQHVVSFKTLDGWATPSAQTITVKDEVVVETSVAYDRNVSRLGEALDNTARVWARGGDNAWYFQETLSHYGGDAAQSGDIADDQSTWFETTVDGPGTLSFYWKVSSEESYDFLSFSVEGQEVEAISGEVDWVRQSHVLPAGTRTLRWSYDKDWSAYDGDDAAWVDQVIWSPSSDILRFVPSILSATKAGSEP